MGGGTGSGLGTYILSLLRDYFPETERLVLQGSTRIRVGFEQWTCQLLEVTSVYPSGDDDVITSPYNTVLAMNQLTEHADSVIPVDNASLERAN